jgi:glutaconyl-CoA/methylmalonyl-CoA decarboxylase subunit gamma
MRNFKFTINGNRYAVEIKSFEDNLAELEVNGTSYTVELEKEIVVPKTPKLIRPEKVLTGAERKPLNTETSMSKVVSPLPGLISQVLVKEGDSVKKGSVVLHLDAMKMENNILAEKDGIVKSIKVKEGDTVLQGALLVEIQ